jgi:hypothetical protein
MPRMKRLLRSLGLAGLVLGALAPAPAAEPPLPAVSVGGVERLPLPASRHVDARPVDVWLPADYTPMRRHAVRYVHDGQMLFDARTTWNKQAWDIHLAVDRLMHEGCIPPTIVVGIWNNDELRRSEYDPQKFLPCLAEPARARLIADVLAGRPRADAYLRHLVEEIKSAIDARYATLPLAAFEYLRDRLQPPDDRRLYMDHGMTELDAIYAPYQAFVNKIVRKRGWSPRDSALRVVEGTGHHERAWAARVHLAIEFLLGGR